ncbi:hypothetical protein Ancab_018360 [Ancistrocladus abbreviatus]
MLPSAPCLPFCRRLCKTHFPLLFECLHSFVGNRNCKSNSLDPCSILSSCSYSLTRSNILMSTGNSGITEISRIVGEYKYRNILFYSSRPNRPLSRSYRRRVNRRLRLQNMPVLDEVQFNKAVSQLPRRFTAEDLHNIIILQDDPLVCLELFRWASQDSRFRHDVCSFHITIKKLGVAKMYKEMDDVVNQVLALPHIGSEGLYNTMIYYFTEARKLTRAVNIFKHMKCSNNLDCGPSIRTYNLLFAAFLSMGSNTYINHLYTENMRYLFRQLVNDGIEPDIFSLNSMIKGYVLSNHVNDALRLFHQMGVVYSCMPNAISYDYLIYGLCAQGRTNNARELLKEMKEKGFIPNGKSYNSLVNSLSLAGEVEEAVRYLLEMTENQREADFITYRTLLDEMCRQGCVGEAMGLLKEFQKKELLDEVTYNKLSCVLQDDFAIGRSRLRC